jgi:hypothetical protein
MNNTAKDFESNYEMSSDLKDMFVAAMNNDVPTLKAGLEHLDVNITDEQGRTLLHYAAGHLADDAVDFLLEQDGIDPTIKDYNGATAASMPMVVYQGSEQGNRMFNKLKPYCYPASPEEGSHYEP